MKVGTLHALAVEVNTLMSLFGSAWQAGLKQVRDIDRHSIPDASQCRHIDFMGLSRTLDAVSGSLEGNASKLEALANDAEATAIEKKFRKALLDWCILFRHMVLTLSATYIRLHERSDESLARTYSLADYQHDVATFDEIARQQKEAGARVNGLYEDLGYNDMQRQAARSS